MENMYKISVNGQDCDSISDKLLKQVQALIEENEGKVLSFDEIFEFVDRIYLDEDGQVESYEYAL